MPSPFKIPEAAPVLSPHELQINYEILEKYTDYAKYRREYQTQVVRLCKKLGIEPSRFDSLAPSEYSALIDRAYAKDKSTAEDVKRTSEAWKAFKLKMGECVEKVGEERPEFKATYEQMLSYYIEKASLDMPAFQIETDPQKICSINNEEFDSLVKERTKNPEGAGTILSSYINAEDKTRFIQSLNEFQKVNFLIDLFVYKERLWLYEFSS